MNFAESIKTTFNQIADHILSQLQSGEEANVNLQAEESTFVRFNNNKVRQNTHVEQRSIGLLLQKDGKTAQVQFSISGQASEDIQRANKWLNEARNECALLPPDPFQVPMQNNGTSDTTVHGKLLTTEELFMALTEPATGCDLAGLYCAGPLISANKNSKGQSHWFANESFFMDYSLYLGDKAVKGAYAGTHWDHEAYKTKLRDSKFKLSLMERPKKTISAGKYRTYLAPAAVAELAGMFQWEALSYGAFKKGNSALTKLANKEKSLSKLFSMRENFSMGLTHRFNSLGEMAPETLDLITKGELKNFLISSRSAKEYSVAGNSAENWEGPRALEIMGGSLSGNDEAILKELGTGLYLSNLHYLNWSDRLNARITGMTRYACFWVENGQIIAPINDMRFDESLYDCLGENLLDLTATQEVDPMTSTYDSRAFGGKKIPGMLISDFKFTL